MPIDEILDKDQAYASVIENHKNSMNEADKFIEILKLSWAKIDIRNEIANAVNGAEQSQKAVLPINSEVLIAFVNEMKRRMLVQFEAQKATYIASQTPANN